MRPTKRCVRKTLCPLVLEQWGTAKLHPSQNLRLAHGALWCIRCGCFAADNVRKLAKECREKR